MSEQEQPQVCKRCGRPDLNKELDVSDEAVKEYFRCALGGRKFTKTFNVMNNELSATFEALSAQDELLLNRLNPTSTVQPIDVRMLLSLKEVSVFDPETSGLRTIYSRSTEDSKKLLENPAEELDKLTENFDSVMLGVLRRMHITFVMLINTITEHIIDEDFYKGVGLL